MANNIKLETCPKCGATLSAKLVKLLKTDPVDYSCPKEGARSRKDWEESWGKDVNVERGLDELFKENLDEVSAKHHAEAS